ncbi:MAG: hypothetical protein MJ052_02305 [Sphaerochaetaceae bacterium]|nr:hypothetical protein [Sphaerochaetaceae bacterium]
MEITLFSDDFLKFPLGAFPYDREHSAMGEYHFFPCEGYTGEWFDPQTDYNWRGPTWLVTSQNGKHFMEQQRVQEVNPKWSMPTLAAGSELWKNFTLEADIRVLSKERPCGFLVRFQTPLAAYAFWFENDKVKFVKIKRADRRVLAERDFECDCLHFYHVSISCIGDEFTASIDGRTVLSARDKEYSWGYIALCAYMPTQYTDVRVSCSAEEKKALCKREKAQKKELKKESAKHPQMKLVKKISLGNFGAGRQIRFGHLTGTDEWFFIICQHQKRVYKDRYPFISCMTAVSMRTGKVLWQKGEPRDSDDVYEITTDLPFQIYDIDGDGVDEVICAWDYRLRILDGSTGTEKASVVVPENSQDASSLTGIEFKTHAMQYLNVDAIRIVNVSGNERPSDIMIKDRYARLWVYDCNLKLKWYFNHNNTGHFPYAQDFDGDGKDEIFACYNMISPDGKLMWQLPVETDHCDEIIAGKFDPDNETPVLATVNGWEGFIICNTDGRILLKDINGHSQRISAANYRPADKGFEIVTTTYWGPQGIIYMHDGRGRELWHKQMRCNGNTVAPVNWDGNGTELFMTNPSVKYGGLMDGEGRMVVPMPDDGHPQCCTEVIDLCSDHRDEIVVWDRHSMWIYTQDKKSRLKDGKEYVPEKFPHFNGSNYRGECSWPVWKESTVNEKRKL